MLLDVSTTSRRSVPVLSIVSQCMPFCGRASATKPIAMADVTTTTRSQRRAREGEAERARSLAPSSRASAREVRISPRAMTAPRRVTATNPTSSH
jgi:hypothetical protein